MYTRKDDWRFGCSGSSMAWAAEWYGRHEPVVDRWLHELEAAQDPSWPAAEHAAFCLVHHRASETDGRPDWEAFDVTGFLFQDLPEGGTVGLQGPVEEFFDHLVEIFRRFVEADLVDAERGEEWLAELTEAREDFLVLFDEERPWEEREAIWLRRLGRERVA